MLKLLERLKCNVNCNLHFTLYILADQAMNVINSSKTCPPTHYAVLDTRKIDNRQIHLKFKNRNDQSTPLSILDEKVEPSRTIK